MGGAPAAKHSGFTWDDYRGWSDGKRWELIDGEAFDMTPAPSVQHQAISRELEHRLFTYFTGRKCQAFDAPIDVKLSDDDVVQPDIVVVCNRDQIKETHIEGPPTLVIEILSPASLQHDRVRKMALYARFGVQEFWVVTPDPPLIEVFRLDGPGYRLHAGYGQSDTLRSPRFPKLKLPLAGVFDFPVAPKAAGEKIRETAPPYGAPHGKRRSGPSHYRRP